MRSAWRWMGRGVRLVICVCNKQSAVTHTFPLSPISSNGNNSVTNKQLRDFLFFFLFLVAFQLSVVGGFSSALFLKLLPWETGKVKQLTRCHLMNSLLAFTHSQTATSAIWHTLSLSSILFLSSTHTRTHTHCKDLSSTPCQAQRHTTLSKQAESPSFSHAADCCLSRPVTLDHIMSDMRVLWWLPAFHSITSHGGSSQ